MASQVIYSDASVTITKVTPDGVDPQATGYWESLQYSWAAGTPQANLAAIQQAASTAKPGLQQIVTATNTGTLTLVQLTAAVKLLAQVDLRLVRLALGEFDSTA